MTTPKQPRYIISVAAEMLGIPTYTLRYYESVGIIHPARSRGNVRLYSDEDLDIIRRATTLMNDMGVNLAGVEIILRMTNQVVDLQNQMAEMEEELEKLREEKRNE